MSNPLSEFIINRKQRGAANTVGNVVSGAFDDFKTRQAENRKYQQELDLATAKSQMMSPKDIASTNYLNKKSSNLGLLPNIGDQPGMVLDRIGPSGPTFVNQQERLRFKTLASQATQLPRQNSAYDAVIRLRQQYDRSISPISIKKGSNPLTSGMSKLKQGFGEKISSATGLNPEMNRYLANRGAFSSLISKGGFDESGVLTAQDIERVLAALPSEFSTKEVSDIGWAEVEGILSDARKRFESQSAFGLNRADTAEDESDLIDDDPEGLFQ